MDGYRGVGSSELVINHCFFVIGQFLYLENTVILKSQYLMLTSVSFLCERLYSVSSNGRLPGGKTAVVFQCGTILEAVCK